MSQLLIFDAYELVPGVGKSIGIYNYAKNLWRALQQGTEASVRWCVICNVANAEDFAVVGDPHVFRQHVVGRTSPSKWVRQVWLRVGAAWVARSLRAHVYFSPKGFLPAGLGWALRGGGSVVVVHDLIPLWYRDVLPGYFGLLEEYLVNRGLLRAVRQADAVVAISEATAADIRARTGRASGVHVVYNGIPLSSAVGRPYATPYLFSVSSQLPHKNLDGLLAAYRTYRAMVAQPLPLVVCGVGKLEEPGVLAVRNITDAELHGYYAHAEAVIFLSLIEGFGFPPVEAMSHGTRVLCSDVPSLREVTQGQAVYASPKDSQAIARALIGLLTDDAARSVAAAQARRAVAASFTWGRCAGGISRVVAMFGRKSEVVQ